MSVDMFIPESGKVLGSPEKATNQGKGLKSSRPTEDETTSVVTGHSGGALKIQVQTHGQEETGDNTGSERGPVHHVSSFLILIHFRAYRPFAGSPRDGVSILVSSSFRRIQ